MNKGKEFLRIPSEFQDITFPKKVTDKNILTKGPRLYSDKTLPHSAKLRSEGELMDLGKGAVGLQLLCSVKRERLDDNFIHTSHRNVD